MKIAKTWFIVCLLLISTIIGIIPITKANNQDSFGYAYKDSNTIGGPTYNWIEIKDTGNAVPTGWWGIPSEVDIGFSFNYYGNYFNHLEVSCTGLLSFDSQIPIFNVSMAGLHIGSSPNIHGFLAPFWSAVLPQYDPQTGNIFECVYIQTIGESPNRLFVVEWLDVRSFNDWNNVIDTTPNSGITFEAILNETSNDIVFQYKDVEFGSGSIVEGNNGGFAVVGIEDPSGITGLEYSFFQPTISEGLAILFSYPAVVSDANMFATINAPVSVNRGQSMSYVLSYGNLGGVSASDVLLQTDLSSSLYSLNFISASDGGIYDSSTGIVTWNIGSVDGYPSGHSSRSVTVEIPIDLALGTSIHTSASITCSNTESRYDDNSASVATVVTGTDLPTNVDIQSTATVSLDPMGTPIIRNTASTTFDYNDPLASGVDINIHLSDGGPDITGPMTGPSPTWTYTTTFGSRIGDAVATFTAHYPEATDTQVVAHIEIVRIDPAGYIYDAETLQRVYGATVWLQMPNDFGGWTNVPTGEDIPIGDPDVNPQITGENGRYQWDTLPGTYRVHVEAPGYYPAYSIAVTVPPPVTDLHVGLVKIPLQQDNSLPVVQPINAPLYPMQVNSPVGFSSSFTDSNPMDTHSAVWSWSDGYTSKGIITETNGEGTVTGTRIYTCVGVYAVTLKVSDSNGGSSEVSTQEYIVIYDPNAGFVTGGGWINSPTGAYPVNPTLTGKAIFGFVSKYQKGANIPSGNTEFDFRVANLNFHGVSYDWLVVAGMKAQFKGSGTINGAGNYNFMLTAEDGGNQGQDTFRIKIWETTTDLVVYDNGAQSRLSGGSIIVHK
jgi:hypothetical protein